MTPDDDPSTATPAGGSGVPHVLRLYICGPTGRSRMALASVRSICDTLPGAVLEVVDVLEHPDIAERERIVATPTLERLEPKPLLRIVGDMADLPLVCLQLGVDQCPDTAPSESGPDRVRGAPGEEP